MKKLNKLKKEISGIEKEMASKKKHTEVVKAIGNMHKDLMARKYPKKIEVKNFPEQKTKIEVKNLGDIKFPKSFKVDNLDDIKIPEPHKSIKVEKPSWFSLKGVIGAIGELTNTIKKQESFDFMRFTKKKDALAVRLVDKDGVSYYTAGGGGGGNAGTGIAGTRDVKVLDSNGAEITVQNPFPTDGDSIYAKDVNENTSDIGTFTGDILSLFNEIGAEITDATATNPKTFTVKLQRPIDTGVFRVCSKTGNFSNVKIILKDASNAVVGTIDDSANNTKYTSNEYPITPTPFCQMVWEFHTADAVTIDFIAVAKSLHAHSLNMYLKPDGTVVFAQATAGGNPKISLEEYDDAIIASPLPVRDPMLEIARGNVTGQSKVNKFGAAPDFDTGDGAVTVWDGAEDGATYEKMVYTYSTTADITHIVSDNAGDSVDIEVQGLDTNGDLTIQTKTLNGTTAVALDTPLKRVFRMKNVGATALLGHAYTIVSSTLNTANVRAIIQIGNEQTEMAIYTVPTGKTAYLKKIYASSTGASRSTNYDLKLKARPEGGVFQLKHHIAFPDGEPYDYAWGVPNGGFSAGTDIEVTAQITAGGVTGASVIAGFDLILVDN